MERRRGCTGVKGDGMEPRLEVNGSFCPVRRSKVAKRSRSVEWARRSIGVEGDGVAPIR